jgi:hypothetical protein
MPAHLVAIDPSMMIQRAVLGFGGIGSSMAAIITKVPGEEKTRFGHGNTS